MFALNQNVKKKQPLQQTKDREQFDGSSKNLFQKHKN